MSQWSHNHPEEMAEIAALPPSQQNAELRHAIGYDPDQIRDEQKEPSGWTTCSECGARLDKSAAISRCIVCGSVIDEGE